MIQAGRGRRAVHPFLVVGRRSRLQWGLRVSKAGVAGCLPAVRMSLKNATHRVCGKANQKERETPGRLYQWWVKWQDVQLNNLAPR